MFSFGAGVLIGTPLQDGTGAAITNPSPIEFAVLQEVTVEESWESKTLYGANQYPVAAGRGKANTTLKAKAANFNAALCNAYLYGVTATTEYDAIYKDLTGTTVPTSPYTITPTGQGSIVADLGVVLTDPVSGLPYTRVASSPTGGQYSYSAGTWTFAVQDYGKTVYINYAFNNALPASGRKLAVLNQLMGVMPTFQVDLMTKYGGKTWYRRYYNALATKFTRTLKNDDFTLADLEIQCFTGSNGRPYDEWHYE